MGRAGMLVFGWIAYSTISVLNMLWLWDQRKQRSARKSQRDAFPGLFHDLVSPMNAWKCRPDLHEAAAAILKPWRHALGLWSYA